MLHGGILHTEVSYADPKQVIVHCGIAQSEVPYNTAHKANLILWVSAKIANAIGIIQQSRIVLLSIVAIPNASIVTSQRCHESCAQKKHKHMFGFICASSLGWIGWIW